MTFTTQFSTYDLNITDHNESFYNNHSSHVISNDSDHYSCVREVDTLYKSVVYTMYAIIFVTAVLGNLFVCHVVLASSRMRTVTNYFILNLSIGDILITFLCVPVTCVSVMEQVWPLNSFLCTVISYIQAISVFISAYTLVAISIDKFMVIMWPLRPRLSKKMATWIILGIWMFAGVTVWPTAAFSALIQPTEHYISCGNYMCSEDYTAVGKEYGFLYTMILMILQYVIPFTVLVFTYTSIAIVIWCHRIPGEAENSRDRRIARSKKKMVKMMVTVVCVFTLCWLPYNILLLFEQTIGPEIMELLYFPLHMLAMSHACYNPVIYCYMNSRFREGLHQILRRIPCCTKSYSKGHSCGPPSVGIEATDSALMNRTNTYTTYVSMRKKNGLKPSLMEPVRSASLRTNHSVLFSRKLSGSCKILDQQI